MFEGEIIYFDRTIYRGQTKHTKFKHGYGKLFKSKEEVIGEIIGLLQSPAQRIISALLNNAEKKGETAE